MLEPQSTQRLSHYRRPLGVIPTCGRPHTQPLASTDKTTTTSPLQDRQLFHLTRSAVENLMQISVSKPRMNRQQFANTDIASTSSRQSVFFPSLQNTFGLADYLPTSSSSAFNNFDTGVLCHHHRGNYIVTQTANELSTSNIDKTFLPPVLNTKRTSLPSSQEKVIHSKTILPKPTSNVCSKTKSIKIKRQIPQKYNSHGDVEEPQLVEESAVWNEDDDDDVKELKNTDTDSIHVKCTDNTDISDSQINSCKDCLLRTILEEATSYDDETRDTSSPLVSESSDILCYDSQQLSDFINASATDDDWNGSETQAPSVLNADKPPVPHVIWPKNKQFTPRTIFIYGSPSQTAPVIVPTHSVDCPMCRVFKPTRAGDTCPPNSPTPMMRKTYGFYPVERNANSC